MGRKMKMRGAAARTFPVAIPQKAGLPAGYMSSRLRLLGVFLFVAVVSRVSGQTPGLSAYQAQFTNSLARIESARAGQETEALKRYALEVQRLAKASQDSGDLEVFLLCTREVERLSTKSTPPAFTPDDVPAPLSRVFSQFKQDLAGLEVDRFQRMLGLLESYRLALVELEKREVAASRPAEAGMTRAEIGQVIARQAKVKLQLKDAQNGLPGLPREPAKLAPAANPAPVAPAVVTPISTLPRQPLPLSVVRGRVLHYGFDRDERSLVRDGSGKNHHGDAQGARWVREGKLGGGLELDFHDEYVAIPSKTLGAWPEITFSVWVKISEYRGSNWPAFIGSQTRSPDVNISIGIAQDRGRLYAEVDTDNGNAPIHGGGIDLPWNTWFHAAMVYDGKTLTEYINGKPGVSIKASGRLNPVKELFLGRSGPAWNPVKSLVGRLDEVMIFERALSALEIKAIYDAQK